MIQRCTEKEVILTDGTVLTDVDIILSATGFKHHFPFMADSLLLETDNKPCPDNLYNFCVFMKNPKLFYMTMMFLIYSTPCFDS